MDLIRFSSILFIITFTSCIQDDIVFDEVAESVRITNSVDTLGKGKSYQFTASYFNNLGEEEGRTIFWQVDAPDIITIDENGLATGIEKGQATITAEVVLDDGETVKDVHPVVVAEETSDPGGGERSGTIQTTSSYTLTGSFTLQETDSGVLLEIGEDYQASSSLPGLYLYLTNNPNSVANAFEVGMVNIFSGSHSYEINGVGLNEYNYLLYYCKPFSVKVGDGEIGE